MLLLLCLKDWQIQLRGGNTWRATVLGLLVHSSLLRLLHVSLSPSSHPPSALVLPVTTTLDNMAEKPYMSHDNKFVRVLLFFLSLTSPFFLLQLSLLLVIRLTLHQGSLPRFSNQDNPAAFHPCRHVRSVSGYFEYYLQGGNCDILPAHRV